MKNLYITPIHQSFFIKSASSKLDYIKISNLINKLHENIEVNVIKFSDFIQNIDSVPKNSFLFYTVTRNDTYRKFITDSIIFLNKIRPDILITPSLDMLLSYSNKGYQEYLRKQLSIGNLEGNYYGDITDLQENNLKFPYVIKLPYGSGSRQVGLVKTLKEIQSFIKKHSKPVWTKPKIRFDLSRYIKKFYKTESELENYNNHYYIIRNPFVLQQFISDLQFDYKVLVFGEKYFVLKRYVRDNDFRASGSGKFHFERPDDLLLNYAKEVYEKLNVPFISLDIAQKNNKCFMIELQGIGFGAPTLQKSNGYYKQSANFGEWIFVEGRSDLEVNYAEALVQFINR